MDKLLQSFLEETLVSRSANTYRNYKLCLQKFFPQGKLMLDHSYIVGRLSELKGTVSKNTLVLNLKILGVFLSYCQEMKPELNLSRILKICKDAKGEQKIQEVLTKEQVKVIIDSIGNLKHKAIVKILSCSGLRVSELVDLKVEDYRNHELHIKIDQGRTIKNSQERIVALPKCAVEILEEYLAIYRPTKALFDNRSGDFMSANAVQRALSKIGDNVGMHLHPHSFRHYYISSLMAAGVDHESIMELSGHQSLAMLSHYSHSSDQQKRNAVSIFDVEVDH